MRSEEEFALFFRVLAAQGPADDSFATKMQSPKTGAMEQLKNGRKYLFVLALTTLESQRRWDALYDLCKSALELTNEDDSPSLLASDWMVWKAFITAATKLATPDA